MRIPIYPFAAIDTILKYISHPDIRSMIIGNVVKSGLYDESVNHDDLFRRYKQHGGAGAGNDEIVKLYEQIQRLKPGHPI